MGFEAPRSSREEAIELAAEMRVAKVGLGLATMYAVSWVPYAVVTLIGTFGNRRAQSN